MKILFIQPPFMDLYNNVKSLMAKTFPLGIGYLASYLRSKGYDVDLIDPEAKGWDLNTILHHILDYAPDIIALTSMTSNFDNAVTIAKECRKVTKAKTIIGGVHISSLPEETMARYSCFDVGIYGEGEDTLLELCDAYKRTNEPDLIKIKGICYKSNGKITKTLPRQAIKDVDKLPFPARDLVCLQDYGVQKYLDFGLKFTTMRTSRGCPNRCTFCSAHLTMGYKVRFHSPEYVVNEIEHLIKDYGIQFIFFYDDTFTTDKQRVIKICKLILKRGIQFKWCCFVRANHADYEMLSIMKKAGLTVVGTGVESANDEILKEIKKGITVSQVDYAVSVYKRLGLRFFLSFIFGLPKETKQTIENTIKSAIRWNPDQAFFFILTPFPGSEIYNQYNGLLFSTSRSWNDFKYVLNESSIAIKHNEFTSEELRNILVDANKRFYSRPSYMINQLLKIRSYTELKSKLLGGFTLLKQITVITGGE